LISRDHQKELKRQKELIQELVYMKMMEIRKWGMRDL
jgi:hypothetical protein